MSRSLAPHAAHCVVLDSNVWIDILVFDDPATRPIRAALECGTLAAVIDGRCLTELEYVLDYPQFQSRAIDKAAALATVARLANLVEPQPVDAAAPPLPKCKDNANLPDERVGWNGERSAALGAAMLAAILVHVDTFA